MGGPGAVLELAHTWFVYQSSDDKAAILGRAKLLDAPGGTMDRRTLLTLLAAGVGALVLPEPKRVYSFMPPARPSALEGLRRAIERQRRFGVYPGA